ncbi:hypothetical protein HK102_005701 [Quaeritorhiza haematococci]|nr:hypothetical protein HK102_005701 [Quaeritorhiza haematococci]
MHLAHYPTVPTLPYQTLPRAVMGFIEPPSSEAHWLDLRPAKPFEKADLVSSWYSSTQRSFIVSAPVEAPCCFNRSIKAGHAPTHNRDIAVE